MKRNVSLVTLVLIAAVVLSACGGAAGGSPAAAAKAWFDAFTQFDFNRMKDLTCEKEKATIEQGLSSLTSLGDVSQLKELLKIDVSGLKYEDKGVSGNSATVHISGNLRMEAFGQSQEQPIDEDVPMVNEGGGWKVCAGNLPGN